MYDIFHFKRFTTLFKKLLYERSLHFGGSFVLLALFSWFMYNASGGVKYATIYNQVDAFSISFVMGGILWVSFAFGFFSPKEEGYSYLSLPTSHLEKWLSGVLILMLFIALYCTFFRMMDGAYIAYFKNNLDKNLPYYNTLIASAKPLSFWSNNLKIPYFLFVNMTGFMAVGAVYFNKNALVKAMLALVIFFFAELYLNNFIINTIFDRQVSTKLFSEGAVTSIDSQAIHLSLPATNHFIHQIFFYVLLPVAFWYIAYVRLKEKEI